VLLCSGTQQCVAKMALPLVEDWRPWNITDPVWNRVQTAGYTSLYANGAFRYGPGITHW
jgi:hypothetical protein